MSADDLSKVVQSALAATAGLGLGVTLFLSIRRQRTTEDAQATAEKNYGETLKLVMLQGDQQRAADLAAMRTRYKDAAEQMGDTAIAVQVAGVYAMAFLADEWEVPARFRERQMSIDVLTTSFAPESGDELLPHLSSASGKTDPLSRAIWKSIFQRTYRANPSWQRWTGADVDLRNKNFASVNSLPRVISNRILDFESLHFGGSAISSLDWNNCEFREGKVSFKKVTLSGKLQFVDCNFSGGKLDFSVCEGPDATGWQIHFVGCSFSGSEITFNGAGSIHSGIFFHACSFASTAKGLVGLPVVGSIEFDECEFFDKSAITIGLTPMQCKVDFRREKKFSLPAYNPEELEMGPWGAARLPIRT